MKTKFLSAILATTMVNLDNGAELSHCEMQGHESLGWYYVCQESSGAACGVWLSNKLKPGMRYNLPSYMYRSLHCTAAPKKDQASLEPIPTI
jgi:hypothetical protein